MKTILYLLFILSFLTGCISEEARIDSMQPFFKRNDRIMINKMPQRSYDYGEVVLCQFEDRENTFYILRIVGLPGDSLGMEDYTCIINGKKNLRRQIADSVAFYRGISLEYADEVEEEFPNGKKVNLYIQRDIKVNPELKEKGWEVYVPEASFLSIRIPPDHYYVLADTRAWATDSRLYGSIAKKNIKGRITKVFPVKDSEK